MLVSMDYFPTETMVLWVTSQSSEAHLHSMSLIGMSLDHACPAGERKAFPLLSLGTGTTPYKILNICDDGNKAANCTILIMAHFTKHVELPRSRKTKL